MTPRQIRPAAAIALLYGLLIATYLAYVPGLQGPFLLDDAVGIPRTAVASLDWGELGNRVFWDSKLGGISRGVTNLSFALSQYASGLNPYAFKYQNTLLHLLNGALVFWLSYLLLGYGAEDKRQGQFAALAIAAVWLLHPLQVSTVLYAVQRLVLLSTLFVLLALVAYVKGRLWGFRHPLAAFAVMATWVALFGALGVLSKENAVLLPLYLAAVEAFFFRLGADSQLQRRLLYTFLALFILLPLIAGLVYGATHLNSLIGGYRSRDFTLEERLLTQVHALTLYLKLFFVPLPADMSLFHDNFPIQRRLDLPTAALALGYLGLIAAALRLRKTPYAAIGFGILWFFLCHSLESSFVSLELVFEHRNYLAILGPAFVLILGMSHLLATPKLQRIAPAPMLGLAALLALNTAARAMVWGNGELMLRTEYLQRPDSPRVLDGLFELELGRGNLDEARRYLHQVQRLQPDSPLHWVNALRTYCTADVFPTAIAEQGRRAIARDAATTGLFGGLDALTSSYLKGACPTLGYQTVYDLVSGYAQSEALVGSREQFLALILQGRLLVSAEHWAEAEESYSRALGLVEGGLAAYTHLTVNELFEPFLRAGRIDSLGRLLQRVAKPPADTGR